MADDRAIIGADVVREQYADDARLSARQSLWRLRTGPSLYQVVLELIELAGTETVVEVGCGNGAYLTELARRGHAGMVLGLDLSAAMARLAGRYAATVVADAQSLPLDGGRADVVLCMHMLYHVPDLERAIAELRRVVRPGGTVVVSTNGSGHNAELRRLLARAAAEVAGVEADQGWDTRRFSPQIARERLATVFDEVTVHDRGDELAATDAAVVAGYIASWPPEAVGLSAGATWQRIVSAAGDLVAAHIDEHGGFTVTSAVTILVCR